MKKIQLVTKILAIALISAIGFAGIYVQKQNRMENIVKDYSLGMDLEGVRTIELKVSDETKEITKDKDGNVIEEDKKEEDGEYTTEKQPANSEEVKTTENYKKSKKIIEKRLDRFGVDNYVVKLDENTGTMVIEIPENNDADHVVSNISPKGQFKIVDSKDTENVLMDNNDLKKASVLYNTTTSGTVVYLNIEFNKQGAEKLKNISTEYAKKEESTDSETKENEETTESEKSEEEQKEITMKIDDNKMITTSFDETMENGKIQLSMGQATTDREKLNDYIQSTSTIATILNTDSLPIEYEIENNEYVKSDITTDMLIKLAIVASAIALVALIVLSVIYKKSGILAAISYIGFVAVYSLLIRYTNAVVTLEGIAAFAVICVMNYIFNYKLLAKVKGHEGEERKKVYTEEFVSFCIKAIPVCILSIVFCFVSWTPISSFGMTMFWGLVLEALYNITVTKSFLK